MTDVRRSGPAITRREAVAAAAATAAAGWTAIPGWARKRPVRLVDGRFAQGIASGVPGRRAMSLWTRLEDASGDGLIELEVAEDPAFRRVVRRERVPVRTADDMTAQTRVRGLRTDSEYWYRFATRGADSPVGRCRTLPARDSRRPVRVGFWTCQDYRAGHFGQHRAMAAEDLDLVVCLGDYIYEDAGGLTRLPGRSDTTGVNGDGVAVTLDDYRAKYALYRSDPALRELHARHAMCFLWDDHEVVNDAWRDGAEGRPVAGFAERRRNAYRAWFEHQPSLRIGGARSTRIYRGVRVGALAHLFFLDERQYRDAQPCDDRPLLPCGETRRGSRTLLGAEQKRWLLGQLRGTDAPWKLLANGVMMMGLDQPLPGAAKFVDSWDGYEAERAELVGTWQRDGLDGVVVISGDDHDGYAGVVTPTGRSDRPAGAVEVVVPSVTSDNTSELLGADDLGGVVGELNARALNAHLAYADQRHHGYCVLEIDGRTAEIVLKHAASREDPNTSVHEAARFRVHHGTVALERVR